MPRLLITGGSGYLGAELVRQAAAAGHDVRATYHRRPLDDPGAVRLDVRDPTAVDAVLDELRPDVVIHTAYVLDGPEARAVTTDGAVHVARAAARVGAALAHLSTDLVFPGDRDEPWTEADALRPVLAYGEAKADAERLVGAAHPAALVVRTSLLYGGPGSAAGAGSHERLILDVAEGRRDWRFFEDELRSPAGVADVAAAVLEALGRGLSGPLHLAGSDTVSRLDFARLVARAWGADPAGLQGTPALPGRPRNTALATIRGSELPGTPLPGVHAVLAVG
ncbi:MAG: dTDP-4-dehydrorhamnose reductase [uncultured Thermoleophilia bacterium]|uniref:dTDP-4-dehydrorhamnose reductase n=1 Tax=uncultured Thermoleophilia bacterium TaxID=1497501 RepID=A0A6J4TVZ3_9ACTN|nr:MAG: dTDP-4-dehydrorhamnose reductase [uncultured Thermoleophilia bacterium]